MLKADLLLDWSELDLTPYTNITTYLPDAMKKISDLAASQGYNGKYGFTYAVAIEDGAWAELTDPTYAIQIRFDAWEKAGTEDPGRSARLPEGAAGCGSR